MENPSRMHIACATDRAFLRHVPVMLDSLEAHTSGSLRISIVSSDWNGRDRALIRSALPNLQVEFVTIPSEKLEGLSHKILISPMSYARVLLAEIIDSDRIIYLDVDMIVKADIAELWATELGSAPAAAVFPEGKLNAGMLLINARVWRDRMLASQILEWARVHRPREADQASIEAVIGTEILRVDPRWNTLVAPLWGSHMLAVPGYRERAAILHFISGFKPWNFGKWLLPKAYVDEWKRFGRPNGLPIVWHHEAKTLLWQLRMIVKWPFRRRA